jgi:hypothetical protein
MSPAKMATDTERYPIPAPTAPLATPSRADGKALNYRILGSRLQRGGLSRRRRVHGRAAEGCLRPVEAGSLELAEHLAVVADVDESGIDVGVGTLVAGKGWLSDRSMDVSSYLEASRESASVKLVWGPSAYRSPREITN